MIEEIPLSIEKIALQKLRCDKCKNYLSSFPVYLSTLNTNICSRCCREPNKDHIRNKCYELFAKNLKFPCSYEENGCNEIEYAQDISTHELECKFQSRRCPVNVETSCTWWRPYTELLSHCMEKHSDVIVNKLEFLIDMSISFEKRNLYEHNSCIFLIKQKYCHEEKLLQFSMNDVIEQKADGVIQQCQINLKASEKSITISAMYQLEKDETIEICLDCFDESNLVMGTIIPINNLQVNDELLAQFKCSICHKISPPPYFYNDAGSAIGSNLKCSSCVDDLNSGNRVLNLERLANEFHFSCKFKTDGCLFTSTASEMVNHLKNCLYSDGGCPLEAVLKCKWRGTGHLLNSHLLEVHNQDFENEIFTVDISNRESYRFNQNDVYLYGQHYYVVKFRNKLFGLHFLVRSLNSKIIYYWTGEEIGKFTNQFGFKVEIFPNKEDTLQKFVFQEKCRKLEGSLSQFYKDISCFFHEDQLRSCIQNNQITFKFNIFKI